MLIRLLLICTYVYRALSTGEFEDLELMVSLDGLLEEAAAGLPQFQPKGRSVHVMIPSPQTGFSASAIIVITKIRTLAW